jgi:hypothetical protein
VLDEVDAHLAPLPVSPKRKYAVRLALDELLSNVLATLRRRRPPPHRPKLEPARRST